MKISKIGDRDRFFSFISSIWKTRIDSKIAVVGCCSFLAVSYQGTGFMLEELLSESKDLSQFLEVFDISRSDVGNTLETAADLGTIDGQQVVRQSVSEAEPSDIYRFQLDSTSNFVLGIDGLEGDADIRLAQDIDNNQKIAFDEIIGQSVRPGTAEERVEIPNLGAGNYFVAVRQFSDDTTYNLTVAATPSEQEPLQPQQPPENFDSSYGYGMVNAASAVAAAVGAEEPFADVPDLNPATSFSNYNDLNRLQVPNVWNQGITGDGVVVAVVDTGVAPEHPDLASQMWVNSDEIPNNGVDDDNNGFVDDVRGYDFADGDSDPTDENGHGTHMAGTVAAGRNGIDTDLSGNEWQVTGVAYNAQIMPVRVFSEDGSSDRKLAAGIRYAIANGADVIDIPIGQPTNELPQTQKALAEAREAGIPTIMPAGNDRQETETNFPGFPARYASLDLGIAVGAVNEEQQVMDLSNPAGTTLGGYPFFVAPGAAVVSTVPASTSTFSLPDSQYVGLSGTSMAMSYVGGVVALMREANPNLTPQQIEQILTETANSQAITPKN
jgi:subtilisin family serine protease